MSFIPIHCPLKLPPTTITPGAGTVQGFHPTDLGLDSNPGTFQNVKRGTTRSSKQVFGSEREQVEVVGSWGLVEIARPTDFVDMHTSRGILIVG